MEEWTKYVLDNVKNDDVLHYCTSKIKEHHIRAQKALAEEKNQLASELVADTAMYVELLIALDNKVNGTKTTTVVA